MSDDLRASELAYWNHLSAIIDARGHAVQCVFPDGDGSPSFAYTIGLQRAWGAEFLVCGIGPTDAMALLNNVAAQVAQFGGLPPLGAAVAIPPPGAYTDKRGTLSLARLRRHASPVNMPVVYRRCTRAAVREYVRLADKWHGRPVSAIQVVWPDRAGRFPEDDGFDPALVRAQPVFYGVAP